ncbi:F-type H+-transporting ATPase subunit b [Novosphingobium fluoreni]|uniref:ATP synthase subunit b n=1 Tax=Novosphingobium fluoreni TaxID=1391222 RepID=A0A7W6C5K6_9SPHN|nr:ATPase [Novosphingobium fluoreni]MBB3940915.1 F-type H+-transporting ATPase subunit b [Novosphingobium fluoreni]
MPQIAQLGEFYASQIFWLVVFFGLAFFIVGRGMVPKVMDTVAHRDKQISDDFAAAEQARREADVQEEAWRQRENARRAEAQSLIADARAKATLASEKRLGEAQRVIDGKLGEAEARIAQALASASAEIENVATDAARDVIARVAGITVDDGAVRSAVKEKLAHG